MTEKIVKAWLSGIKGRTDYELGEKAKFTLKLIEDREKQEEKHKTCHIKNAEYVNEIVTLRADLAKMREALTLILPMAKGYAYQHKVGSNLRYIDIAKSACEWSI